MARLLRPLPTSHVLRSPIDATYKNQNIEETRGKKMPSFVNEMLKSAWRKLWKSSWQIDSSAPDLNDAFDKTHNNNHIFILSWCDMWCVNHIVCYKYVWPYKCGHICNDIRHNCSKYSILMTWKYIESHSIFFFYLLLLLLLFWYLHIQVLYVTCPLFPPWYSTDVRLVALRLCV